MANYSAGTLEIGLINKADDVLKVFYALNAELTTTQKLVSTISRGTTSAKSSSGRSARSTGSFGFLNVAKWGASLYMARRMGRVVANIVQAGSDYNETLNLWQVAMRDNLDMAEEFVNKMNKAYGISAKTVMNAQAIFKNMIGSLGQITDDVAYRISEALVQMSADFSSLYNVQLESAFTKMQSMLAGQVRPIRSAGFDVTETTLFVFYQQLGGTKTMRQLNRTEKQLLSILAVYEQMGSAGALGDMSKTLNQYANQSRMMVEYATELKTWTGLILKDWLDQHEVLIYINALLITMTEVIKAIAKSRGLGQENFIDGLFETTEATNEEVDELQGKLLDFDKFRSLEGAETGQLAIDERLLEAITGYSSKLDEAQNKAMQLAETWLKFWLTDEGTLTTQAEDLLDTIKDLAKFLGIILALGLSSKVLGFIKGVTSLTVATKGLNTVLLGGIIWSIWEMVEAFDEGDYQTAILAGTLGGMLLVAWIVLNAEMLKTIGLKIGAFFANLGKILFGTKNSIELATQSISKMHLAMSAVAGVLGFLVGDMILSNLGDEARSIVAPIMLAIGAITSLVMAFLALQGVLSWGTALPVITAGIGVAIASVKSMLSSANTGISSMPDTSIVSTASSMGASVPSYTPTSTATNSTAQLKSAVYQALVEYGNNHSSSEGDIVINIGEEEVFRATRSGAKKQGLDFVKV